MQDLLSHESSINHSATLQLYSYFIYIGTCDFIDVCVALTEKNDPTENERGSMKAWQSKIQVYEGNGWKYILE